MSDLRAHRRRRQAIRAGRALIPTAPTVDGLIAALAAERQRAIRILEVPLSGTSPSGAWVPAPQRDYLLCPAGASSTRRTAVLCHEVSHILLGHDPAFHSSLTRGPAEHPRARTPPPDRAAGPAAHRVHQPRGGRGRARRNHAGLGARRPGPRRQLGVLVATVSAAAMNTPELVTVAVLWSAAAYRGTVAVQKPAAWRTSMAVSVAAVAAATTAHVNRLDIDAALGQPNATNLGSRLALCLAVAGGQLYQLDTRQPGAPRSKRRRILLVGSRHSRGLRHRLVRGTYPHRRARRPGRRTAPSRESRLRRLHLPLPALVPDRHGPVRAPELPVRQGHRPAGGRRRRPARGLGVVRCRGAA